METNSTPDIYEFFDYLKVKGLATSTIEQYCFQYALFPHHDLNQQSVNHYLTQHTGKVARGFMRNYLDYLNRKDIDLPKQTGRSKKRIMETLSDDDIKLMRSALYHLNTKYGLMFDLTLNGALRREEVINIKPINFDFASWDKDRNKPCKLRIIGKGDKERIVLISSKVMHQFKKYLREKLSDPNQMKEPIFDIGKSRWWQVLKEVSEYMLNKRVRPHMLRHTTANELWESGKFDIIDIKNYLGHADISTTQVYLHPDEKKSLSKFEEHMKEND